MMMSDIKLEIETQPHECCYAALSQYGAFTNLLGVEYVCPKCQRIHKIDYKVYDFDKIKKGSILNINLKE